MADQERPTPQGAAKPLAAFIEALDADPEAAGKRYERLRAKLLLFFVGRELQMADMLADEAIDRLAMKLLEGQVVVSIEAYLLGIARHIAQEEGRRQRGRVELHDRDMGNRLTFRNTSDEDDEEEQKMLAVELCLKGLTHGENSLLQSYYAGDHRERISNRSRLSTELGVTQNALRKRVFRLRQTVEDCARNKLQGDANGCWGPKKR